MPLWTHQVEAADFIMRYKKGALWHDTGTGKSQSAIEIADQLGAKSILVLCPVIATEHWKAQFAKHGRIERQCLIVREPNATLAFTNVIIAPFSIISKYPRLPSRLKGYRYDLLIIDEAHALMSLEFEPHRLDLRHRLRRPRPAGLRAANRPAQRHTVAERPPERALPASQGAPPRAARPGARL